MSDQFGNSRGYQSVGDPYDQQDTSYRNQPYATRMSPRLFRTTIVSNAV